ncbi:DUF732 domain-containing protein [Mycobacterium avium]|uniref:DUF732 domain-containing protein n=1 Tax=Mycobacterium avium TaxID=1764 RepID=UPI00266528F1|nr:DUF732 domain-containing protein [Mycobacterium avium]MDO2354656.1 DUF732 domain-containing protein [Mycobacterium avium subsp. hominissuis]
MSTADDQAATVAGVCDDATTVVPPVTQAAPGFAWSAEDGYGDTQDWPEDDDAEPIEIPDASWAACFAAAAPIVFAAALVLAIAMVALFVVSKRQDAPQPVSAPSPSVIPAAALPSAAPAPTTVTITPTPPATVTVTATPQAAPPPAPTAASTSPAGAPPDPDTVFRNAVRGIPGVTVIDWEVTEAGAHRVCGYLRAGHSRDDAVQQVLANDPTFTPQQAWAMVNATETAYCPDQS